MREAWTRVLTGKRFSCFETRTRVAQTGLEQLISCLHPHWYYLCLGNLLAGEMHPSWEIWEVFVVCFVFKLTGYGTGDFPLPVVSQPSLRGREFMAIEFFQEVLLLCRSECPGTHGFSLSTIYATWSRHLSSASELAGHMVMCKALSGMSRQLWKAVETLHTSASLCVWVGVGVVSLHPYQYLLPFHTSVILVGLSAVTVVFKL